MSSSKSIRYYYKCKGITRLGVDLVLEGLILTLIAG